MQLPLAASVALWAGATAALLWVSREALRRPGSHGFYRFFGWQCIVLLVLLNLPWWEDEPFSPRQLLSWLLLFGSPVLAVLALRRLQRAGRPDEARADAELFGFERTTRLVSDGAFRLIRHPMYTALLMLAWGAWLKHPSPTGTGLVVVASLAFWLTALRDEAECQAYFGEAYADYMRRTKRFVPYVL